MANASESGPASLDLIELLYRRVNEADGGIERWLADVERVLEGHSAVVVLRRAESGRVDGLLAGQELAQLHAIYERDFQHHDPFVPPSLGLPPATPFVSDELVPFARVRRSDFYRRWMRPNDMRRHAGVALPITPEVFAALGVQQGHAAGGFRKPALGALTRCLPHLQALLRLRYEAGVLAPARAVVANHPEACAVLSPSDLLIASNAPFEDVRRHALAPGREVRFVDPHAQRGFERAKASGVGCLEASVAEARMRLELAPLEGVRLSGHRLLIARPAPARLPPHLAPVADAIARGLSDKEIADELGLSGATARTYVQRIYARLGVRNRAQLATRWRERRG